MLRNLSAAMLLLLACSSNVWALDPLATRWEQIQKMTPAEKEELQQKLEKFLALPPEEQEKLRRLDQELNADPQAERLRRVMQRYYEWLKMLSPADRADLLALPPADRISRIKKLKHEQDARLAALVGGAQLSTKDVQVLYRWMEEIASAHEAEVLKELPKQGEKLEKLDDAARRRAIMFIAWQHWRKGGTGKMPPISDEQLNELSSQLSSSARKTLEAVPNTQDRLNIVRDWVQALVRARFAAQRIGKFGAGVGQEELTRFYYHDLSQQDRDRLKGLPSDEMHRELWRLYLQHKRAGEAPGSTSGNFSPGDFPKGRHFRPEEFPPSDDVPAVPPKIPPATKEGPSSAPADERKQ